MATKKAKKPLGKKAMKKTKGGVIAIIKLSPTIVDGTSNTIMPTGGASNALMPSVHKKSADGSV